MIDEKELIELMVKLSESRHFFCSEADFQHYLALELHKKENLNDFEILLEFPTVDPIKHKKNYVNKKIHLDIYMEYNKSHKIGIELKYKTKKLSEEQKKLHNDFCHFDLSQQGACDIGRYNFLKDVLRLQELKKKNIIDEGFVIFLTNEDKYWKETKFGTVDEKFKIFDGKKLDKVLSWDKRASKGTTKGIADPLRFDKEYLIKWRAFFKNPEFKYLLLKV
jgi:hypothetical protein